MSASAARGRGSVRRLLTLACMTLLAACGAAGTAVASPSDQSTAYQIDAAHDGHIADAAITAPLTQQWATTLPGATSYPLIVNGAVYVTADDQRLYALNQATGSTLWSTSIGGTYHPAGLAYDRGRVFTVSSGGLMRALDAGTGSSVWSTQLPGQYSFSSPPTAIGGVVYVGGAGSGGTLYAVRERDGHVLWTRPVENGDSSSPAVDSSRVYVTYACQQDYAFDRVSGTPIWHYAGPCSGGGGATPVVADGKIFSRDSAFGGLILSAASGAVLSPLSSGPPPAVSGGVAFTLNGSTLNAIANSGEGTLLWQFSGDGSLQTAPVVVGGLVFVGSSLGELYALDATTGTVSWSTNAGPPADALGAIGAANGTLAVAAGNRVIAYRTAGAITVVPASQAPPTIDGAARGGELLAADVGIWSGMPSSYAYQWQRCDGSGGTCADVGGATGGSLALDDTDIGATFRVRVTAANAIGPSSPVTSGASSVVAIGVAVNQSPPAITGSPRAGQTLSVDPGTWSHSPSSYGYEWQRCQDLGPFGSSCEVIAGATASTYGVAASDIGYRLMVRVTAMNAGGASDPAESARTPVIMSGPPVNSVAPDFAGYLEAGQVLTADHGTWSGDPTSYAYQWFTCDVDNVSCPDIAGAVGQSYLVSAADVGRYIGVEVVASNGAGMSDPADSDIFGPVLPALPTNVTPPAISGTAQAGLTLTADHGSWRGSPTSFDTQWYACDASLSSCSAVNATAPGQYSLGAADIGRRLAVGVVATNAGGSSDEAISDPTATVTATPGPPPPPPAPVAALPLPKPVTIRTRVLASGRVVLSVRVSQPGTLTGVARASASALARGCRVHCFPRKTLFGTGSVHARKAGVVTLIIKPNARARTALAASRKIAIRVKLTFRPPSGAATTTVRSLSVKGTLGRGRSRLRVRAARQRILPAIAQHPLGATRR